MTKKTIGYFDFYITKTTTDHKMSFAPWGEIGLQRW